MSELDESFAKLLGKQPSDKERQDLYRVRDALGLKTNDALWLVLMALQHYETRYERFPAQIESAAQATLHRFQQTADAVASAAAQSARNELTTAVSLAARDVARYVEGRQRLKWLLATVTACVVMLTGLAWYVHAKGIEAGLGIGYGRGYDAAKDERAAASWAATPEGRAAYRLAEAGSVRALATCSMPGWYTRGDACYPAAAADGQQYGWRLRAP